MGSKELSSVWRHIISTFGRQIGSGLLQLGILALIARIYGPEGNGNYSVSLLVPMFLVTILNFGITPANIYYLGSGQVTPFTAWKISLRFGMVICVVGITVGAIIIFWFSDIWFPKVPLFTLLISLFIFPFILLQSFISGIFQGMQCFYQFNLTLLVQPILTLFFLIIFYVIGFLELYWAVCAYLFGCIVTLIVSVRILHRLLATESRECAAGYEKLLIGYGVNAYFSNVLAFLNNRADIFLVNFFLGPSSTGIYVVAVQLVEKVWIFSQAVNTVLLPKLSQLRKSESVRNELASLMSRLVLWVTGIASTLLALIALPLIWTLFGNKYSNSFFPLLVLLPGVILLSSGRVLANDIAALGRPGINMRISIFATVLNVVLNIVLIPQYDVLGASFASLASYVFTTLLIFFCHYQLTRIPTKKKLLITIGDIKGLSGLLQRGR